MQVLAKKISLSLVTVLITLGALFGTRAIIHACWGPKTESRMRSRAPVPVSCGSCGGTVVPISSVTDDRSKPSRNVSVWTRSSCANPLYCDDDVICTQCSHAYSSMLRKWTLGLRDPAGFKGSLCPSVLHFPVPSGTNVTSSIVYGQELDGSNRIDSVGFWCSDDKSYSVTVQAYANKMNLVLKTSQKGRLPGEVYLRAESIKEFNK